MLSIPFATLSTNTLHTQARTWMDGINPIPRDTRSHLEQISSNIENFVQKTNALIDWFKNLKSNLSDLSIEFMTWTFEFLSKTVLHTPTFLFNTQWIKQHTLTFTGLAVVMSLILVIYEGFQRMFSIYLKRKESTEMGRITARIPIVITLSALSPFLFFYGFEGLNWITQFVLEIGKTQMQQGFNEIGLNEISFLEILMFIAFDIALLGMLIPILLQNFRRWFEIITLCIISPLALSCWMFKRYEHFFNTWWNSLKQRSLVQLVYAVYLVIIGTLMFGTKTPESELDILTKMGIMIGGLYSMANPPRFVRSYIDQNEGIGSIWKGAAKAVTPHKYLQSGFGFAKSRALRLKNWVTSKWRGKR